MTSFIDIILMIKPLFRKILNLAKNIVNTFHNNNFISKLKNGRQNV